MAAAVTEFNKKFSQASSSSRGGLWVGRVEAVNDPKQLNRIRVRIFSIHGDATHTPTTALPWAEVSDLGGGGYDYGNGGLLYPIGSTVWVMFEMEKEEFPVVIGGRRGIIARDSDNPQEMLTLDGKSTIEEETWKPPEENEIPKDIFQEDPSQTHPTRTVWYKSFKGHTIVVEDKDEGEFLRIIDRAGQIIELSSPVKKDNNKNNEEQRGTRNAIDDDQVSQDSLVESKATIRIKDVAGQEILMNAEKDAEKVVITSRNRDESSVQILTIDSTKDAEKFSYMDKDGNSIILDTKSAECVLTIKDTTLKVTDGKVIANGEGDKAPLDSKIQTELKARRSDQSTNVSEFNDHAHPLADFICPLIPLPGPPIPTFPGTTPGPPSMKPSVPMTSPSSVGDTASELVYIDS